MQHPGTNLEPAVAGSDPVGVQEGDPTVPLVAGNNPRVVRVGHS
jgi:hypothetical protein